MTAGLAAIGRPPAVWVPAVVPLERNPAAVYLARLGSPESRRTMRTALANIVGLLAGSDVDPLDVPWWELHYQHTTAIRTLLAQRYAPSTANKHLAALRGVLRECRRLGHMSAEDETRAADLEPVRGSTLPAGRALDLAELRALFAACAADTTAAGRRDAAILAVLAGAGLRRSEAAALDVDDLRDIGDGQGELVVRRGKGRKARTVPVSNGAKTALDTWTSTRGAALGPLFVPLFVPIRRGGTLEHRHMSGQAILGVLRKRARQAHVSAFTPHDLRRTYIGELLDAGADIASVQALAGHASVTTTARYDRRGERAKRYASGLLHVPYVPPAD